MSFLCNSLYSLYVLLLFSFQCVWVALKKAFVCEFLAYVVGGEGQLLLFGFGGLLCWLLGTFLGDRLLCLGGSLLWALLDLL